MADVVQWTIDQFYGQLQNLKGQIDQVSADLNADKAQLTQLYSQVRNEPDPGGSAHRAALQPLIHQNSVLRLSYLAPIRDKFNQAVAAASKLLNQAGYTTPTLTGLGQVQLIVPVAAAALVLTALAAVAITANLTASQRNRTAAVQSAIAAGWTPAQVENLMASQDQQLKKEKDANPPLVDWGAITMVAGLVAAVILVPQLLRAFGPRRAET